MAQNLNPNDYVTFKELKEEYANMMENLTSAKRELAKRALNGDRSAIKAYDEYNNQLSQLQPQLKP